SAFCEPFHPVFPLSPHYDTIRVRHRGRRPSSPEAHDAMFPAPYETFISLFNAQRFWDAHEVLEGPWRRSCSRFYKGLIIYASAFVHLQRGNPVGIGKQMRKVLHYLPPFEPCYMGLDV